MSNSPEASEPQDESMEGAEADACHSGQCDETSESVPTAVNEPSEGESSSAAGPSSSGNLKPVENVEEMEVDKQNSDVDVAVEQESRVDSPEDDDNVDLENFDAESEGGRSDASNSGEDDELDDLVKKPGDEEEEVEIVDDVKVLTQITSTQECYMVESFLLEMDDNGDIDFEIVSFTMNCLNRFAQWPFPPGYFSSEFCRRALEEILEMGPDILNGQEGDVRLILKRYFKFLDRLDVESRNDLKQLQAHPAYKDIVALHDAGEGLTGEQAEFFTELRLAMKYIIHPIAGLNNQASIGGEPYIIALEKARQELRRKAQCRKRTNLSPLTPINVPSLPKTTSMSPRSISSKSDSPPLEVPPPTDTPAVEETHLPPPVLPSITPSPPSQPPTPVVKTPPVVVVPPPVSPVEEKPVVKKLRSKPPVVAKPPPEPKTVCKPSLESTRTRLQGLLDIKVNEPPLPTVTMKEEVLTPGPIGPSPSPSPVQAGAPAPVRGTVSRNASRSSIKDELPMRETRRRPPANVYTPSSSPKLKSTRPGSVDLRERDDSFMADDSSNDSRTSFPSGPVSAMSSARSSEERSRQFVSARSTPISQQSNSRKDRRGTHIQTLLSFNCQIPIEKRTSPQRTVCPCPEIPPGVIARSISTQTTPISDFSAGIIWTDEGAASVVSKTTQLLVDNCYRSYSRFERKRTVELGITVKGSLNSSLQERIKIEKQAPILRRAQNLDSSGIFSNPPRYLLEKYGRTVKIPMDFTTVEDLMSTGEVKTSLEMELLTTLMSANAVVTAPTSELKVYARNFLTQLNG